MARSNYKDLINYDVWANGDSAQIESLTADEMANGFVSLTKANQAKVNKELQTNDQYINSMIRYGIPLWDTRNTYAKNSSVIYSGEWYVCKADTSKGQQPDTNPTIWENTTFDPSLYLLKSSNLSDVANAKTAFDNIKQPSSTTNSGVVQIATQSIVNSGTNTNQAVTPLTLKNYADANFNGYSVGFIIQIFGNGGYGTSIPNFLPCNGAAVSRTTYANLFAKIGTTYGAGDGSTTFNVPNFQGQFIRSASGSAPPLGTVQSQGIPSPSGTLAGLQKSSFTTDGATGVFSTSNASGANVHARGNYGSWFSNIKFNMSGVVPIANEIRPANFSTLFFIKY